MKIVTSDIVAVIRWAEALPDVSNYELYVTTGNATDLTFTETRPLTQRLSK